MKVLQDFVDEHYYQLKDAEKGDIEQKLDTILAKYNGKLEKRTYNKFSSELLPKIKPHVNMIDNTKGPFQLQLTNNMKIAAGLSKY